jgi:hypothetical protein
MAIKVARQRDPKSRRLACSSEADVDPTALNPAMRTDLRVRAYCSSRNIRRHSAGPEVGGKLVRGTARTEFSICVLANASSAGQ